MKKKLSLYDWFTIITIVIHILLAAFIYIFNHTIEEKDNFFIGLILLITGIPSISLFITLKGHKYFSKFFYLLSGITAIILGLIFMLCPEIHQDHLFIIIGIFDIIRGLYEAIEAGIEIKKNKLELIEFIPAIGDIVFGILLIIELENGYYNHLIFVASSLVVVAIKYILDLVFYTKINQQ